MGVQGMRLARESRPAVLLLDILLPELNGWEVCRRLREETETATIPIIMVTGRAEGG